MEKTVTKRTINKGVEVNVVIREQTYDVYIDITPEADISQKIKCEEFSLKCFLSNDSKKLEKTIHLEKKNLKYSNKSASVHLVLEFKCEDYKCKISLAPKVYVLDKVVAEAKRKHDINMKNKKKKIRINDKYRPGMATSRGTKYSKSNITKPYSGGLCSPK